MVATLSQGPGHDEYGQPELLDDRYGKGCRYSAATGRRQASWIDPPVPVAA
jgi:hypothetical protein